tara:strand:+ start:357 stop:554 length:198 start_codon:yes stop_codon:yes gene_type:complete
MNEISSKRYFENKSYQPNIKTKPPNLVMRKEGFYQVPDAGLEPDVEVPMTSEETPAGYQSVIWNT